MDKTDKTPTELAVIDTSTVQNLIYNIRGQQVMLDFDLAILYGYELRSMNQQVKRNIARFPEDFMFQLTREEVESVKSQIVISREDSFFTGQGGGRRTLPYAFTEQGIYMLATVLKGSLAEQQSIKIMRAFREMRHFIANNRLLFERISSVELRQLEFQKEATQKFDEIFDYISDHEESTQKIYFDGQIYDAFSLLASLISQAHKSIILIDGYIDTGTLDLLSKKNQNIPVTIYTFNRGNKLTASEIQKFNAQYPTIDVKINESFHDRFLILDNKTCYHIGASLKDAGKKSFALSLFEDSKMIQDIINRL